jgi:ABC-type transporter Mla subunit MlaD
VDNTRPTPPSGIPAAVSAGSTAQPSVEEITAPKSEATMVILAALDGVRTEFVGRMERLETTTAAHGDALKTLADQVNANTKNISEQATAITNVAKSAAVAAELSAQALAKVSTAQDDARKMVESAMAIQKGSIALAVTEAIQPVLNDVESLKASNGPLNEALGEIVNELGIEDRVALGREVKPGEKKPERTLRTLNKQTKIVQVLVAAGMIAEAVIQILKHT